MHRSTEAEKRVDTAASISAIRTLSMPQAMTFRHLAFVATACIAVGCTSAGHHTGAPKPDRATTKGLSYRARVDRRYIEPKIKNGVLIMPFFDHSFSARCYDTLRCRVLYDNTYVVDDDKPSGPFTEALRNNLRGGWGSLDFPSVAKVTWTSKDGVSHDETIDLGRIFRSKLVRYAADLDVSDVNLSIPPTSPDIILVVEDRSISIYMKAHISLNHPTDPGNKLTNFKEDAVVAYTRTF